ncbi:nuclear transport factor 2 family protein [Mucilaginibacter glaciei]|uniref:Nuclear transport factor 2 family protein n=1 Tax=Mucilaginibacter glaciei TaxID=2772109 RepID=A0A926NRL0_9SPHI|nr:nuclear transport factor 2 family protein [Mucilaginibacter glaciei]MBD1394741.1 nuclear transport factor 2 family protein [Mucilaginibacter glaciei]
MTFSNRLILFSALSLTTLGGCNSEPADNKPDPKAATQQVINEHFQMLNAHDLKGLSTQYEVKAHITTPDFYGVAFGPQGADQIFHESFYLSPDAKYLVDNTIVNDSTAVVEYDVVGLKESHDSPIRYDLRNCSVFKIKNNKIVSEATYSNPKIYHTK